jgi:hypothetical protein
MENGMTLLMDIEHPESSGRIRLMCGPGFSFLRTDATGRDIYGFVHKGVEYLLLPLSFTISENNVLLMTIPAQYEEWFAQMRLHGARIRFSSPCGEPPFVAMPEECRSNSGVLRIDDEGVIAIVMDRTDATKNATPALLI